MIPFRYHNGITVLVCDYQPTTNPRQILLTFSVLRCFWLSGEIDTGTTPRWVIDQQEGHQAPSLHCGILLLFSDVEVLRPFAASSTPEVKVPRIH